jgi:hypothetical protein
VAAEPCIPIRFGKAPNEEPRAVLSQIAQRQAARDDAGIHYSDIPALTGEQLAGFRRTRGADRRQYGPRSEETRTRHPEALPEQVVCFQRTRIWRPIVDAFRTLVTCPPPAITVVFQEIQTLTAA